MTCSCRSHRFAQYHVCFKKNKGLFTLSRRSHYPRSWGVIETCLISGARWYHGNCMLATIDYNWMVQRYTQGYYDIHCMKSYIHTYKTQTTIFSKQGQSQEVEVVMVYETRSSFTRNISCANSVVPLPLFHFPIFFCSESNVLWSRFISWLLGLVPSVKLF